MILSKWFGRIDDFMTTMTTVKETRKDDKNTIKVTREDKLKTVKMSNETKIQNLLKHTE